MTVVSRSVFIPVLMFLSLYISFILFHFIIIICMKFMTNSFVLEFDKR